MPLEHSAAPAAVGRNIDREQSVGKPRKQAIAIALDVKRRAEKGRQMPARKPPIAFQK